MTVADLKQLLDSPSVSDSTLIKVVGISGVYLNGKVGIGEDVEGTILIVEEE